jgi:hypothetical protein
MSQRKRFLDEDYVGDTSDETPIVAADRRVRMRGGDDTETAEGSEQSNAAAPFSLGDAAAFLCYSVAHLVAVAATVAATGRENHDDEAEVSEFVVDDDDFDPSIDMLERFE